MDKLRMNISVFASVLNLDAHKLWHWYRDHLSGFRESESSGEHYRHDLKMSNGETVRVPIYEPDNFGSEMAIDEKQIGEEMHTIVSNQETGKIAVMAVSMKYDELKQLLDNESIHCRDVEVLTRDLSPLYAKVGNDLFPNSSAVADKFHIIRSLMESCQDVRVRLRQDTLRNKRLKHQVHKEQEKQRKEECLSTGKEYISKTFEYEDEKLSNGETVLESLAHSRYLLFKYSDEWSASQERRANALFLKFPEIKKVYERSCEFRNWMKRDNVGKCMRNIKDELRTWMQNVERDNVDEMLNFKSLIERHMLPVLNYFRFGVTNAIAENINSHIQKFVTINQGTRDREFFYFRMKKYFT